METNTKTPRKCNTCGKRLIDCDVIHLGPPVKYVFCGCGRKNPCSKCRKEESR